MIHLGVFVMHEEIYSKEEEKECLWGLYVPLRALCASCELWKRTVIHADISGGRYVSLVS